MGQVKPPKLPTSARQPANFVPTVYELAPPNSSPGFNNNLFVSRSTLVPSVVSNPIKQLGNLVTNLETALLPQAVEYVIAIPASPRPLFLLSPQSYGTFKKYLRTEVSK
ncbi:hypothetical protein J6590_039149 [Homalodisca vitripennis]|nr:hypothetical protein J6590_039149 [Homalodisca vitripennis]